MLENPQESRKNGEKNILKLPKPNSISELTCQFEHETAMS